MQAGDLEAWESKRVIIILEGVLVEMPQTESRRGLTRKKVALPPAEKWGWQKQSIKYLNHTARMHSIPVDVVTFISEEVAEAAAEWFQRYMVEVSTCEYRDYEYFCESLQWTMEVDRVIDSDPGRMRHYGQRGQQTVLGGTF